MGAGHIGEVAGEQAKMSIYPYLCSSIGRTLVYDNFHSFAKFTKVVMLFEHFWIGESLWEAHHKHQVALHHSEMTRDGDDKDKQLIISA